MSVPFFVYLAWQTFLACVRQVCVTPTRGEAKQGKR